MHQSERPLRRREASEYLKARGFPVAVATLNKLACVGGGPAFQTFGRIPLYKPQDLDAWAAARLSPPRHNTSDKPAPDRKKKGRPPKHVADGEAAPVADGGAVAANCAGRQGEADARDGR